MSEVRIVKKISNSITQTGVPVLIDKLIDMKSDKAYAVANAALSFDADTSYLTMSTKNQWNEPLSTSSVNLSPLLKIKVKKVDTLPTASAETEGYIYIVNGGGGEPTQDWSTTSWITAAEGYEEYANQFKMKPIPQDSGKIGIIGVYKPGYTDVASVVFNVCGYGNISSISLPETDYKVSSSSAAIGCAKLTSKETQITITITSGETITAYIYNDKGFISGEHHYEYVTIRKEDGSYAWEKLGSTDIELVDYLKKTDAASIYATKTEVADTYATKGQFNDAMALASDAKGIGQAAQGTANVALGNANSAQATANEAKAMATNNESRLNTVQATANEAKALATSHESRLATDEGELHATTALANECRTLIDTKANYTDSLAGYNIQDAYTKDEIEDMMFVISKSLNNKVDTVEGKTLTSNDFTDDLKSKLDGIAASAQVNVIEGVQIDGADMTASSKKVNIITTSNASATASAFATKGYVDSMKHIDFVMVDTLPEASASTMDKIYFVPLETTKKSEKNIKEEYITIKTTTGGVDTYSWEKIGDTKIDLSGYAEKATTLAGYGITDAKITDGVITLGTSTITPLTEHQDISGKENANNKVTSMSSLSTNEQYPSAKAVYDAIDSIVAYEPFPSSFKTDGTLQELVNSIRTYSGAKAGKAFLGGISGSCVPFSGNAECKVEYMLDTVAVLTVNSSNIAPYTWFYNTASTDFTWKSTTASTNTVSDASLAKSININGSKYNLASKTSDLTNDSNFLTEHQDISGKADKATTLAGYGITDAYTQAEVDDAMRVVATALNSINDIVKAPTADGTYTLQCTVADGVATYSWVAQS